jgi:hypothetical protein
LSPGIQIIFPNLETIFWVNILQFFDADSGYGMEKIGSGMEKIWIRDGKIRVRDKHPGSATLEKIKKVEALSNTSKWALHVHIYAGCLTDLS